MLFATGVRESQFTGTGTELNASLARLAIKGFTQVLETTPETTRAKYEKWGPAAANNEFYRFQAASFVRDGENELFGASQSAIELIAYMREAAVDFLLDYGHDSAGAQTLVDESHVFVWASVHCNGSQHPPHVHSDACISGVYYAKTEVIGSSGLFVVDDPRGKGPFDHLAPPDTTTQPFTSQFSFEPREGSMLVFPSWLVHRVAPVATSLPRVSFSFNVLGSWDLTAGCAALGRGAT